MSFLDDVVADTEQIIGEAFVTVRHVTSGRTFRAQKDFAIPTNLLMLDAGYDANTDMRLQITHQELSGATIAEKDELVVTTNLPFVGIANETLTVIGIDKCDAWNIYRLKHIS